MRNLQSTLTASKTARTQRIRVCLNADSLLKDALDGGLGHAPGLGVFTSQQRSVRPARPVQSSALFSRFLMNPNRPSFWPLHIPERLGNHGSQGQMDPSAARRCRSTCGAYGRVRTTIRANAKGVSSAAHCSRLRGENSETPSHAGSFLGGQMNVVKCALGVVLVTFLCVASAWAQENAELKGTVTDPSGAVVPNATITITNTATGETKTANQQWCRTLRFRQPATRHLQPES